MGLAGIDDLERSHFVGDFHQPAGIPEQQLGTFVDCRPPRKTDGEYIRFKHIAALLVHQTEQSFFCSVVRSPYIPLGNVERITQAGVVFAPARNVLVEQLGHCRGSPGCGMHAIRNGMNVVFREHLLRDLAVTFCHAVDVVAVLEREKRHVQFAVGTECLFQFGKGAVISGNDLMHQIQRKLVVSGRNRSVGSENAFGFDQSAAIQA